MTRHSITLDQFPRSLRRLERKAPKRAAAAMLDAARRGHKDVTSDTREKEITDRGDYLRDWSFDRLPNDEGAILYNSAPHAAIVEEGSRPHWAPFNRLLEWVIRKLLGGPAKSSEAMRKRAAKKTKRGKQTKAAWRSEFLLDVATEAAYLVQAKIAKEGTEGRFVMKESYPNFPRYVGAALEKQLEKI